MPVHSRKLASRQSGRPKSGRPRVPIRAEHWLDINQPTLHLYMPDLWQQHLSGLLNDQQARSQIHRRLRMIVQSVLRAHSACNEPLTEQVTQELIIRLAELTARGKYQGDDSATGWIHGIARMIVIETLYRSVPKPLRPGRVRPLDAAESVASRNDPIDLVGDREMLTRLRSCINTLDADQIAALTDRFGQLFDHQAGARPKCRTDDPFASDQDVAHIVMRLRSLIANDYDGQ